MENKSEEQSELAEKSQNPASISKINPLSADKVPSAVTVNAGTSDPTDGRKPYQWETGYTAEAWLHIRRESIYLFFVFILSLLVIYATWKGWLIELLSLSPDESQILKKYAYYSASGMLGGTVFGIKFFYRAVARGYWNYDRVIWRLKSPLVAMAIAFIMGAMIDASFISARQPISGAAIISIGFLSGYFADEAVGKMYEIANVIFGKSATTKAGDGK